MRITDERITAYGPTFEIVHSRYEYVGASGGTNATGDSYYLFVLPNTTFESAKNLGVSLCVGFSNDENSKEYHAFTEPVHFNNYSSEKKLLSIYTEANKIAVTDKSRISFWFNDANSYTGIYFTDSRYNKYIIVQGKLKISSSFLLASCTPSSAIVADSWFLLKNGETEGLICNSPMLIKTNQNEAINLSSGIDYVIQKPGIVYYVNFARQPKIMIVNPGDVLDQGGYLYYILEIA